MSVLLFFFFLVKPVAVRVEFVAISICSPRICPEPFVTRRGVFILWVFIPIKVFVCRSRVFVDCCETRWQRRVLTVGIFICFIALFSITAWVIVFVQ